MKKQFAILCLCTIAILLQTTHSHSADGPVKPEEILQFCLKARESINSISLEFNLEYQNEDSPTIHKKEHKVWWDTTHVRHDRIINNPNHPVLSELTPEQRSKVKKFIIRDVSCKNCTPNGSSILHGGVANQAMCIFSPQEKLTAGLRIFDPRVFGYTGGGVLLERNYDRPGEQPLTPKSTLYDPNLSNWKVIDQSNADPDIIKLSTIHQHTKRRWTYMISRKHNYNILSILVESVEGEDFFSRSDTEYELCDSIWFPKSIRSHMMYRNKKLRYQNIDIKGTRINQKISPEVFSLVGINPANDTVVQDYNGNLTKVWQDGKLVSFKGSRLEKLQPEMLSLQSKDVSPVPVNPEVLAGSRWQWYIGFAVSFLVLLYLLRSRKRTTMP
jgi:hypothetical protein